ncbi:hypothetical protein B0O99DRAFT_677447 [Bisporella sp. PMI_857]|nr:hypothetical protein B0O99DRAFT_677447 [Bisporella sp. PMI_857]
MPPKKASTATVYIVTSGEGVDSVYATESAAEERASEVDDGKIEKQELIGGSITAVEEKTKAAPKPKAAKKEVEEKPAKAEPKAKAAKKDEEKADAPKANTAAKKTKPAEEQRAANAKKPPKADDSDLPDDVKALLSGSGSIFDGQSIVVTGTPPVLGRKNADKLVEAYGGKLVKAIAKKTSFVVLGNDAGPKKLDQIAEFGLKTYTDQEFIDLIKAGGSGSKRAAADDDDEDEEEEEEKPKKPAAKKQKK